MLFDKEYSDSLAVELVFSSLWSHVANSCSCDVIFCKNNNLCKTVRLHGTMEPRTSSLTLADFSDFIPFLRILIFSNIQYKAL